MKHNREQQYFDALKTISRFRPSEWFEDHSEASYGLSPREALEMAYDNIRQYALDAVRGRKRPKAAASQPEAGREKP